MSTTAFLTTSGVQTRFSLQSRYAGERLAAELAQLGISNRAVTISGRATISETEISEPGFVGADVAAIRTRLTRFLTEHHLPRANDLVILDMEPRRFSPRHLGDYEGQRQADLITAYRRRIRVAREVLRSTGRPGVRLGMYQVIVPDEKGQPSDEFERRMCGYLEAGRQAMYDELDFICPVLYQRFGPADAPPATLRQWVASSTRQALEGSLALTRSTGARIPLVPIVSFWVFNGRSGDNRQAVSPESVALQVAAVQQSVGVAALLFWSAWQTKHEMESAKKPVEPIDIHDFLLSVGALSATFTEPAEGGA